MSDKLPWEVNSVLALERLRVIADIIMRVRRDVAESMEPEEGDGFFGLWVSGTRVHARLSHHLKLAAESGQSPWLELVDQGMQFTFAIEGVPIRIYRGEPERPTRGARKVGLLEYARQQELFDLGLITMPDVEWVWRVAVETDPEGRVFNVNILQIGPGNPAPVRNRYSIPLTETVPALAPTLPFTPAGVELPPAQVEAIEYTSEEEGGEARTVRPPSSSNDNGH